MQKKKTAYSTGWKAKYYKDSQKHQVEYSENYFNVGEIRVIRVWGKETEPLPRSVCTNLAQDFAWTILRKLNEGNLPKSPESRDNNENVKDIEIQEGKESRKWINSKSDTVTRNTATMKPLNGKTGKKSPVKGYSLSNTNPMMRFTMIHRLTPMESLNGKT